MFKKTKFIVSIHPKIKKNLLKRIEERGLSDKINVYTHSEMLPAHGYPHLRKYKNLKGNIGKAWFDQTKLFEKWNGTIVVNTNCMVPPKKKSTYLDRLYTYKIVGVDGAKKIKNNDFLAKKSEKVTISGEIFDVLPLLKSLYKKRDQKIFSKNFNSELKINFDKINDLNVSEVFKLSVNDEKKKIRNWIIINV